MLVERLLSGGCRQTTQFSFETELRNLELLKLRFGESNLHSCDVMLRDIKDSERINSFIKKQSLTNEKSKKLEMIPLDNLSVAILSKGYWPIEEGGDGEYLGSTKRGRNSNSGGEKFIMPPCLKKSIECFIKHYVELKRLRTLKFHTSLGSVNINLTFSNGSFKFKVLPIQAAIISLFDDTKKALSSDFIAKTLEVPLGYLRKKIMFWVCKGVLIQSKSTFSSRILRKN
jgi:anaphase-promoting complex subunit 2